METVGSLPFQVESLVGKETQKMITVPGRTDCKEVGGKGKRQVWEEKRHPEGLWRKGRIMS